MNSFYSYYSHKYKSRDRTCV